MGIRIGGVSKTFADFGAIDALRLDGATGSLVGLLGLWGCGQSTLLHRIAFRPCAWGPSSS